MIVPDRWRQVLAQLQANGFPEVIIAGGALRDLDNGKPVKDVDVFVRLRKEDVGTLSIKDQLEIAFGEKADRCVIDFADGASCEAAGPEEYYAFEDMQVVAVYDFKFGDELFQIIVMQTEAVDFTRFVIDDFDIGFCQIWHDTSYPPTWRGVRGAYLDDKKNKRLTVVKCPDENALERTKKRIARLLEKYPDFTPCDVAVKSTEEMPF